ELLHEMLTIKSDDIKGRYVAFQSIIKGLPIPDSHVPESFKLLVRQLNGLVLAITPMVSEESKHIPVSIDPLLDEEAQDVMVDDAVEMETIDELDDTDPEAESGAGVNLVDSSDEGPKEE